MIVSRLKLINWRNFRDVDVKLGDRVFLVGPNASGKSNFLDVFRFLRDIAKPDGGGLQKALKDRGSVSKIRCLAARTNPEIGIEIHLADSVNEEEVWKYSIGIKQQSRGKRRQHLSYEKVWYKDELILDRPDTEDKNDDVRLTQTHLENINDNVKFRAIAEFFSTVRYMHLIPQLLQHPDDFIPYTESSDDPFGRNFLRRIGNTSKNSRNARLRKIEEIIRIAVPQLTELKYMEPDDKGKPHLEAIYEHWRPKAGRQREDQFSDGTLRLIALLWAMLESESLLLFEEPELSLHSGIVKRLTSLMYRMMRTDKKQRQFILSTHSYDLLSDKGIGGEEVLLFMPNPEGTSIRQANTIDDIKFILDSGASIGDAVMPMTEPQNVKQLNLFDE